MVKLVQTYEDDTDTALGDIVQDFVDELLGDEDDNDNSGLIEQLSRHIEDFCNCKKKTITDLCALVGTHKSTMTEDLETYEDDAETEEKLDIHKIARVIADDMPSQFPEPTEEDSWDQTLDYLSLDDPYDAWEGFKDFWNSFKKYDEDCDDDTELMLASMIDDEKLKKWCSTSFSEEDRAVFDFEIIKPEVDYE